FSPADQWVYLLLMGLPVFLYFLLWETFWDGRTPGKAALDLRVVRLDGSKPAFSGYLVRWLLRIIDITLTSGSVAVISILLSGKGQRLGDMAAGTTVITERKKVRLSDTLIMDLPKDYQPNYPQVRVLSDRDVQDIKSLLLSSLKSSNYKVIGSLSEKVSGLLEVQPREKPVDFLKKVILDYNYYTRS
ncbi:MAG TPA: RDD family protein, partial [Salinimicrobium sp.]|nr:RDD family protein [Salinimicrobium sp.]